MVYAVAMTMDQLEASGPGHPLRGLPDDPLLNSAEAAMYLNVPMSTLRNQRRAWGLNPFKTGRALQYRRSELDAWLERNRDRPLSA